MHLKTSRRLVFIEKQASEQTNDFSALFYFYLVSLLYRIIVEQGMQSGGNCIPEGIWMYIYVSLHQEIMWTTTLGRSDNCWCINKGLFICACYQFVQWIHKTFFAHQISYLLEIVNSKD